MSDDDTRLERAGMRPAGARVIVTVTVAVEVGGWSPEHTIAEAVDRSVKDAKSAVGAALKNRATVLDATFARVICDAEASHG